MRRFKRITIYAIACMLSGASYSQSSIVPSATLSTTGGDEVRGRDGTTCKQGTYSGPTFDTGISMAPMTSTITAQNYISQQTSQQNQVSVYARIIVPIGSQPTRVNCDLLYRLEVERLELELKRLKESGSASITIQ